MLRSTRPDGWSVTIQRLLRLTLREIPGAPKSAKPQQCLSRHPTGKIWRSILAQSIFADLSLGITVGRRFIRLEYLGLSGVILYELPNAGCLERDDAESKALTLLEVFGDDDDPEDLGMDVDHLLDRVSARLIYAPAYACTSFVVGQVMNALMHSHRMRPIATSHGILVDSDAFTLFDSFGGAPTPYKPKPTIDALSYLRPVDTHARVKRATAPFLLHTSLTPSTDTTYKVDNDQDKDQDPDSTFDGSISTIDSIGPYTPPHSRSGTPIIVGSGEQHSCPPFLSLIEPPPEDYVLMDRSNLFTVVPNAGGIHCGTARAIPSHRDREN